MSPDKLNELTQQAAFRVAKAFSVFDDLPEELRNHAQQVVMQRVQHIRNGVNVVVDGPGLIREIIEEPPAPEVPVEEPPKVEEVPVEEPPAEETGSTSETPAA